MALTRKMLEAMGIENEKIETIIEAHIEVTDSLKKQVLQYKEDAEKLPNVQKELDGLKAKGDDGYKEKYEAEKQAHDALKADIENEKSFVAKEKAYREMLKVAGVKEKFIDTIVRAEKSTIENLQLDEDGKIENIDTLTESATSTWSDFVATTTTKNAEVETPPANNNSQMSKEDLYKKDDRGRYVMSASERQKVLAQNPNLMN